MTGGQMYHYVKVVLSAEILSVLYRCAAHGLAIR